MSKNNLRDQICACHGQLPFFSSFEQIQDLSHQNYLFSNTYLEFFILSCQVSTLLQGWLVKKLLMLDRIQLLQKQKKGDVHSSFGLLGKADFMCNFSRQIGIKIETMEYSIASLLLNCGKSFDIH